ncbi:MAG: alpha/beta hydrolase [Saprospiraceae bacterium]|nr:alpha/beta hydrolase [Saprospiraceae bacterium]
MKIIRVIEKIGKFFLYFVGVIIILLVSLVLIIRFNSNGQQEPFKDLEGKVLPNSIALHEDKIINGVPQRLTIRGKNVNNPVLLKVHGGPGNSHIPFLSRLLNTDLEDLFVVCYWDQRGSGTAYSSEIPDSTITLQQIVDDGITVTNYLREQFKKEKIYIEGTSWGTTVSAFMVQKRPELFFAYVGIGQMGNQTLSEQISYDFVLQKAKEANDTISVSRLKSIGRPPYKTNEEMIVAVNVERVIGRMYSPLPPPGDQEQQQSILEFLIDNGTSFESKLGLFIPGAENKSPAFELLWPTCANVNLLRDVPEWKIPVYILQGEYDHQTEFSVAKSYYDSLKAPEKQWFTFDRAGHNCIFENPQKYRMIIENDVLKR